jgi:hypothetical protein
MRNKPRSKAKPLESKIETSSEDTSPYVFQRDKIKFDLTVKEGDFPIEPERNYTTLHKHEYETQKEEMANAIRILKMTDEEVVNTSTYNAVARYL